MGTFLDRPDVLVTFERCKSYMLKNKRRKTARPNRRDTERYRRFAEAYLALGRETFLNAEKSALKAGYSSSYAHGRSYELLDRVGIQAEFERIRNRRRRSTIASAEEVLEVLTAVVRTLPNELEDKDGNLIPLGRLSRDQAQMIAGYKTKRRTFDTEEGPVTESTIEYKLADRLKAAEMIGRHHGIFEADNHQKAPEPGAQRLVAFPVGDLSLEEWQRQAIAIMAGAKQTQNFPALLELRDPADTSPGT